MRFSLDERADAECMLALVGWYSRQPSAPFGPDRFNYIVKSPLLLTALRFVRQYARQPITGVDPGAVPRLNPTHAAICYEGLPTEIHEMELLRRKIVTGFPFYRYAKISGLVDAPGCS